jgi:hypothetical protein
MTVAGVAYVDFWANYISGDIYRDDGFPWDEGPILVTYDSGYSTVSDEMAAIKTICLEVAARALTGPPETFGLEVQELRGVAPAIFLTEEEKLTLGAFTLVGVG